MVQEVLPPPLLPDPQATIDRLVEWIRAEVASRNRLAAVVGVSGGLDSAVVALLCQRALGVDRVIWLKMPDAAQFSTYGALAGSFFFPLRSLTDQTFALVSACGPNDCLRRGNIAARLRMILLYDVAFRNDGLVVGTGNRSEIALGYFTKHGDGACDLAPLARLYKTQVRQIAPLLGVPQEILDAEPSAGLWPGQTDAGELGYAYAELDPVIAAIDRLQNPQGPVADRVRQLMGRGAHKSEGPAVPMM